MEEARIREDVDPESPEYRRKLIIVLMIVLGLTIIGGMFLGYRIRSAENAEDEAIEAPAETDDTNEAEERPSPREGSN